MSKWSNLDIEGRLKVALREVARMKEANTYQGSGYTDKEMFEVFELILKRVVYG